MARSNNITAFLMTKIDFSVVALLHSYAIDALDFSSILCNILAIASYSNLFDQVQINHFLSTDSITVNKTYNFAN